MAKLPDFQQLGEPRAPRPSSQVVGYNPSTGAETAPGQALAQVGQQTAAGADHLWNLMQQEQEKTDTIKVEDAWNQYKQRTLDLTHGDKGLLKTEGADAVNGQIIPKAKMTLQDARSQIMESLGNDQQRTRFRQRADITDLQTQQQLYTHLATEQKQYAKTTYSNSIDLALAAVSNDPNSEETFLAQTSELFGKASDYMRINGVQDTKVQDMLKQGLVDRLQEARVKSLAAMDRPIEAEALLKKVGPQIKNSDIRESLERRIGERAVNMNARIHADEAVTERIGELVKREAAKPPPRAAIENGPATAKDNFNVAVNALLKREGGYVAVDGASGAPAKFGINQKYNPEVDVKALTKDKAVEIYRNKYWNAINGDTLAPATALVALDAAALQGVEVAKKLIADTGGDPQAMIAKRREQLQALGKDPRYAKDLPGWINRLDGLAADAAAMPDGQAQTVGAQDQPQQPRTSNLPNARDVDALLGPLLQDGKKYATKLYGDDPTSPKYMAFMDRWDQAIKAKLGEQVSSITKIQKQNLDDLQDSILGTNQQATAGGMVRTGGAQGGGMMLTSVTQFGPQQMNQYQQLDAAGRAAIDNTLRIAANRSEMGDPRLLNELSNQIWLPGDDPKRINSWAALMSDPRVKAGNLNYTQRNDLYTDMKRRDEEDGSSYASMRQEARKMVRGSFQGDQGLTDAGINRTRAEYAEQLWKANADKVYAQYIKDNKDPRPLFDPASKDYLASPLEIARFKTMATGSVSGLAGAAAAVAAGTHPPLSAQAVAALPQLPPAIRTRPEADAWMATLPPEVKAFRDRDGTVYPIPGRTGTPNADQKGTTSAPETAPAQPVPIAAPQMDAAGKIVPPAPAAPLAEPTIEDFAVVTKADTVRGRIAEIAAGRKRAAEIRKGGAQGPQFQLSGPLTSIARGATAVGDAMLAGPAAVGGAIGRAIPTELEAIYAGFDAIKKTRKVSAADQDILEQTLKYGLLSPADEQLAKGLLAKLQGKK